MRFPAARAARAGLARLLASGVALFVPGITPLRHAAPCPLPMLANRLLLLRTPAAGRGLALRAVLHHLFQSDPSFLAQRPQHLGEPFLQLLLLFHTKIRPPVLVHFLQPGQPLESRIKLAASRHFPRRSNPLAVGVHPEADPHLRSERRTPAFFCTALDGLIKGTPVQAPYQCPHSSRRMVFADEVFHIHGSPAPLRSVPAANQRLFANRICLAHAASLRQTSFFARWKCRGFLHSFFLKGPGLDAASLSRVVQLLPRFPVGSGRPPASHNHRARGVHMVLLTLWGLVALVEFFWEHS